MQAFIPPDWQGPTVTPSLTDLKRFRDQPHRFLLDLFKRNGDVIWYGAGPLRFVLGAHPRHVRHVLVEGQHVYTKATFQYRLLSEVTGDGLLTSDGKLWRTRRRIQQPAFQRTRLGLVTRATARATEHMWHRWRRENRQQVDIAHEMFRLSLDVVMDVLFSYPLGEQATDIVTATLGVLDHLIRRSRSIPGVPAWFSPVHRRRFRKALEILDQTIQAVLENHRSHPPAPGQQPRDLLDLLLAAEDEQKITLEGIRNELLTMLIAGHETVASVLTWAWWLLSQQPEVTSALIREAEKMPPTTDGLAVLETLPLARNVLSEALRLYPPAWIVTRRSEPPEQSNRWLPRNTLVMLSPYLTHHHPGFWERPDTFDPGRFATMPATGSYFPFGTGPRLCIGKDFALVEATLVLAEIARRCRLRPLSSHIEEYAGVTLQPAGGLPVEIVPHVTSTG